MGWSRQRFAAPAQAQPIRYPGGLSTGLLELHTSEPGLSERVAPDRVDGSLQPLPQEVGCGTCKKCVVGRFPFRFGGCLRTRTWHGLHARKPRTRKNKRLSLLKVATEPSPKPAAWQSAGQLMVEILQESPDNSVHILEPCLRLEGTSRRLTIVSCILHEEQIHQQTNESSSKVGASCVHL